MNSIAIKSKIPEGDVPLLEVHGTSFECGEQLGVCWRSILRETYMHPGLPAQNRPWFDRAAAAESRAFNRHAPHLQELHRGMMKGAGIEHPRERAAPTAAPRTACSSFAMNGTFTSDSSPLAGQNKDTGLNRAFQYIVLKVCSTDGPGPFTLGYEWDLVGFGSSATGLCIFRNGMPGTERPGFPWGLWALMAKCKERVEEAVELFLELNVGGCACCLLADRFGGMAAIEVGFHGHRVIEPVKGLLLHTNHFVKPLPGQPEFPEGHPGENRHSVDRLDAMKRRFTAEKGRLNWVGAFHCMADHDKYPMSLCRHAAASWPTFMTTATVVAEPAKGRLHVCRGHPCCNNPATHSISLWKS